MKRLLLVLCLGLLCTAAAGAEEPFYAVDDEGHIIGYETEDYYFDMRQGIWGYKLKSDDGLTVYIYSPTGKLIELRKKSFYPVIIHDVQRRIFNYYYPKRIMWDQRLP